MTEVLKKFGRYFLLDRIAQGGMAEIYRARMASSDAGGRLLVIKRIQAGYGTNEEFVTMFKSEIKVTMGFNHPNIVQVYDFGEEQEQPYIAMEFVDGRNLRQYISRFAEMKQCFPIDLAAYVIEQAAGGLFYAHSYKDKITGEPLSIVHRDISPQNILIAYEGTVKVIDFGIAKATTNSESTRAGVIKGKPSYLSPEQITGEVLDGRCDIFALGTVLWELLTGRKLFSGENDLAVLKMIESCTSHVKPPSTVNSDVPKELDYIVLKALAKQREQRYQSAEELRRALQKFVYSYNKDFNSADLSYYAKDLFKTEIVEDRKRVQKLYERAEKLLTGDENISAGAVTEGTGPSAEPAKKEDTTTVYDVNGAPVTPSNKTSSQLRMEAPKGGRPVQQRPRPGLAIESSAPRQRPIAPPAEVTDGGGFTQKFIFIGIAAILAAVFLGPSMGLVLPWSNSGDTASNGGSSAQTAAQIAQQRNADEAKRAANPARSQLRLNVAVGTIGMSATLNGKPVDPHKPIPITAGTPLDLTVEKPGYKAFRKEFYVTAEQLAAVGGELSVDVPLEAVQFGFLTVRTTPSAQAHISNRDLARSPNAEGKPWIMTTPFESQKVPTGTYQIRMTNEVLGMEKVVTVVVQEGRTLTLDERLEVKN